MQDRRPLGVLDLGGGPIGRVSPPRPPPRPVPVGRWPGWAAPALVSLLVLAASRAWTAGALVTDGPGVGLYVRLALRHLRVDAKLPYLVPDLWSGTPSWALTPSLQVLVMVPLGWALGADPAVKAAILGAQILAGCGAYVLARSLWRQVPASVVAGVLYALHPMVVSQAALAGSEPTVVVMAVAPWLVWSLRHGLRRDDGRHLAGAGLLAGFAALNQPDAALGLVLLGAGVVALEAGRGRAGSGLAHLRRVAGRAAVVAALALGLCAFWVLPLVALGHRFVVSSPGLVPGALVHGTSARLGRDPGALVRRPAPLTGRVGADQPGLGPRFFYLSCLCLGLTSVTAAVLARRDDADDGTLTAVLLASAVAVWLSTGTTPLASGGPVGPARYLALALAGLLAGLLAAAAARRLGAGGRRRALLAAAAVGAMVAVPYVAPFADLQKAAPALAAVRFPRFYTVAALGMALGAAYPVTLVQRWAEARRPQLATALAAAVALGLVGLFVVDVSPYLGLYRARPPAAGPAYAQAVAAVAAAPGDFRVATGRTELSALAPLVDAGLMLSDGWPYGLATRQLGRLTTESLLSPEPYRRRALGLSGAAWLAVGPTSGTAAAGAPSGGVSLVPNPVALPLVRAYRSTVVLRSAAMAPELAVGLAYRNIAVVAAAASTRAASELSATTAVNVASRTPCTDGTVPGLEPGLADQFAVACSLRAWLGPLQAGAGLVDVGPGVGAVTTVLAARLQGMAVFLDRAPGRSELALYEVAADGTTLGPALARAKAVGTDEYGLTAFTFDPIAGSAGKRYAFVVTCDGCPPEQVPRMVTGHATGGTGDLLEGGRLRPDRVAAFTPVFDEVTPGPASSTAVRFTRPGPGRWRVEARGPEPALVVVASAYVPGWRARVDGRPAALVEADGAFLGVAVGAGSHVVTLGYHRPAAARAGRILSWASLLALVGLWLLGGRRRARGRPEGPPRWRHRQPRPPLPARAAPVGLPPVEPDWDQVVSARSVAGRPSSSAPPPPP